VSNERRGQTGHLTHPDETVGHPAPVALDLPLGGDIDVRELVVAGGLLGFTPDEIFQERAK